MKPEQDVKRAARKHEPRLASMVIADPMEVKD